MSWLKTNITDVFATIPQLQRFFDKISCVITHLFVLIPKLDSGQGGPKTYVLLSRKEALSTFKKKTINPRIYPLWSTSSTSQHRLPRQHRLLWTKYSDTWAFRGHSSFKPQHQGPLKIDPGCHQLRRSHTSEREKKKSTEKQGREWEPNVQHLPSSFCL